MKKILSIVLVFFAAASTAAAHDIVLREQGKPILGVSYPSDWKQEVGKSHVVATSEDGTAWSVIGTLDDIKDKKALRGQGKAIKAFLFASPLMIFSAASSVSISIGIGKRFLAVRRLLTKPGQITVIVTPNLRA